jgi:sigma-E factor negative regulatory protein RseB
MKGVAARLLRLGGLAGWLGMASLAHADSEARRWLAEMTDALATQSYAGEFLHMGNGPVEKLRIVHRVRDGHVSERLVGLGSARREVLRNDGEMQVILPDQAVIVLEEAPSAGSLLGSLPTFDSDVEEHYQVEFSGMARVIGRSARVVTVESRDAYRFGYRLWLDESSRIPLRTDLIDHHGRVLGQVVFTSLELGAAIPDSAFHPSIDTSRFSVVREHAHSGDSDHEDEWTVSHLPPGYRIRSRSIERLPGATAPVTHLLITDGLASVSVFIEEPPAPPRQGTEGEGRFGSAYAYSRMVAGHQVTAVGEVPAATVAFLAGAVVPAGRQRLELGPTAPIAPLLPSRGPQPRPHPRP